MLSEFQNKCMDAGCFLKCFHGNSSIWRYERDKFLRPDGYATTSGIGRKRENSFAREFRINSTTIWSDVQHVETAVKQERGYGCQSNEQNWKLEYYCWEQNRNGPDNGRKEDILKSWEASDHISIFMAQKFPERGSLELLQHCVVYAKLFSVYCGGFCGPGFRGMNVRKLMQPLVIQTSRW